MEAFNGEIEGTIKRLESPYLPEVTEVRVSNTVWRIFSVQNSPLTFLQKPAFSLLKSRLAKGSLGCLFFGFCHNAGYQLQKTPWKPSLKALLAFVETIVCRFSFLFATHLLLEHLSAQLNTAATAHSALRHNVRVLQADLVKKTFPKCSFTWNPTLLICRCTL